MKHQHKKCFMVFHTVQSDSGAVRREAGCGRIGFALRLRVDRAGRTPFRRADGCNSHEAG